MTSRGQPPSRPPSPRRTAVVLARCENGPTQKGTIRPDGRLVNQGSRPDIQDCPTAQANEQWTVQPERTP